MAIVEILYNFKKKLVNFYKKYFTVEGAFTCILPDKIYLKKIYKKRLNKKLNLSTPKTYHEKGNWLKLYDRRSEYTVMADKYAVRDLIAQKIGEKYLVPFLGVWDSPDEINFNSLPDKFVLKCNHDNGVIICRDKNTIDIEEIKKELAARLNRDYYKKLREWPYKNIPRKIICEKFMENTNGQELLDYKIFCFNGEPKIVQVDSCRFSNEAKIDFYDSEWNYLNMSIGGAKAGDVFKKPDNLSEMLRLAKTLSKGIPFIRVDFNCWNNKLYFGELTFSPSGFVRGIFPEEWNDILGSWIELPKKRRR